MNPKDYQRAKELFVAAIEMAPPEQARFLKEACGGDESLRQEIAAMLAEQDGADWEAKPVGVQDVPRRIPERIGRYRILSEIAEGGMGVVYRAEQTEPVRREVALKLIKLGMDTKEVLARFETERQALALMSHPHVAKVLDGGTTEQGRPYFVMEFVEGVPITDYSDQQRLPTTQRLRLFQNVCQAVQHAHQKGIIHRDLKPSNVLVAVEDSKPVVKVIDFGVAKATQQRLTERTLFTAQGQMIGTPRYMSPEQAGLDHADIDTRTDVYSLGVLLYELLVGARPFEDEVLRAAGLAEMQRIIREVDPPKPSTRLGGLGGDSTVIARNRNTEPRTLIRTLRGDLDWIIMKCLEKDRARRYGSAAELADDLEQYLDSRPIHARPPSTAYQLRKLASRHRVAFGFAGTLVVLLIAFVITVTTQLAVQRRERLRAETAARREQRINEFFHSMLAAASPERQGRDVTVRQVLDAAVAGLKAAPRDEPEIEAAIRETIGKTYREIEAYAQAEAFLQEALAIRSELLGETHPSVGTAHLELANLYLLREKYADAEKEAGLALDIHRDQTSPNPLLIARDLRVRGSARTHLARWKDAREDLEQAIAVFEREIGITEANEVEHASFLESYAYFFWRAVDPSVEFDRLQRRAIEARLRHADAKNPGVLYARHWLAVYIASQGRVEEAESIYREVLAARRELLGPDAASIGRTLRMLAESLWFQGKIGEAESLILETIALRRRTLGPRAPLVGEDLSFLAQMQAQRGAFDEAVASARDSLAIEEEYWGAKHPKIVLSQRLLAFVLYRAGFVDEAETMIRSSLSGYIEVYGADKASYFDGNLTLHEILLSKNEVAELEPLAETMATLPPWGFAEGRLASGQIKLHQGHPEQAAELFKQALDWLYSKSEYAPLSADLEWNLSNALREAGRAEEALPHARAAVEIHRTIPEWDVLQRARALIALGRVQADLGMADEVRETAREVLILTEKGMIREPSTLAAAREFVSSQAN